MKYAVIFEKTGTGYSAYAPDVPGCASAGDTLEETKRLIKEGLEFHFEGTREDGLPIPAPATEVAYIDVEVPASVSHDVPAL